MKTLVIRNYDFIKTKARKEKRIWDSKVAVRSLTSKEIHKLMMITGSK